MAAIALGQKEGAARILDRLTAWGRWLFPVAILANVALAFLF